MRIKPAFISLLFLATILMISINRAPERNDKHFTKMRQSHQFKKDEYVNKNGIPYLEYHLSS